MDTPGKITVYFRDAGPQEFSRATVAPVHSALVITARNGRVPKQIGYPMDRIDRWEYEPAAEPPPAPRPPVPGDLR